MRAYIYAIINQLNGKAYIGQTRNKIARWSKHRKTLERGEHHNSYLQNAYNKYGKENFQYTILEQFEEISDEALGLKESEYIEKYDSLKNGYNIDDGRKSISLSGRENMSLAHIGNVSPKRKLDREAVLLFCSLSEFIGGLERPLSTITGLNRIVFKAINRRETYNEFTAEYDALNFEEKIALLSEAIKAYHIEIPKLKNTNQQRALMMIRLSSYHRKSRLEIAKLFGVDDRSVKRILDGRCLPEARGVYENMTKDELLRVDVVLQTIMCQALR